MVRTIAEFPALAWLLPKCSGVSRCPLFLQAAHGQVSWQKLARLSSFVAWSSFICLSRQGSLAPKKKGDEAIAQGVYSPRRCCCSGFLEISRWTIFQWKKASWLNEHVCGMCLLPMDNSSFAEKSLKLKEKKKKGGGGNNNLETHFL